MSPIDLQASVQVNQTNLNASVGISPNDVLPVGQPEAEGGSNATVRLWSSLRVRQAIVAWWATVSSSFAAVGDSRFGGTSETLTVTGNSATLSLSLPNQVRRLTIASTAAFTLNVNDLPADPGWASAELIILTSSVPVSFTFAGTATKVDVPDLTLADNPFQAGKRTQMLFSKLASGLYTVQVSKPVGP